MNWKKMLRTFKRRVRAAWRFFERNIFKTPFYWLRTHIIDRYHMIDIRNKDYGYAWGWIDSDSMLLLASFKILKDFVELEQPFLEHMEPNPFCSKEYCDSHNNFVDEINDLYLWWTATRRAEWKNVEKLWDESRDVATRENAYDIEEKLHEKDTEQLIRLMKIRRSMWT